MARYENNAAGYRDDDDGHQRRTGNSSGPRTPRALPEGVEASGPSREGKIKSLNERGFGFVKDEGGQEYFFHRTETAGAFDTFNEGDRVKFTPMRSSKGPRAHAVERI